MIKFEVCDDRGRVKPYNDYGVPLTEYRAAFDSRGFKFERWIDSYHFAIFPITTSDPYFGISIKFGTFDHAMLQNNAVRIPLIKDFFQILAT